MLPSYVKLACCMWSALGVASAAHSQTPAYPIKPIRWVVPFAPGGGADMIARPVAQRLAERIGQPITYDNRGGGGGVIAGDIVAHAAPDGYTMLVAAVGVMTVNVTLLPKMPFDPVRDFAPITKLAASPNMIVARQALPIRTSQELVDYARANPRKLTWAMSGIGSAGHLVMEVFAKGTKIDVVRVIYKGAGPATLALLSGEADLLMANPSVFLTHIRSGRLRPIAIAGPKRVAALAETPTLAEAGFSGYESESWYGLAAPARTPPAIVAYMQREVGAVLAQPDLVAQLANEGAYPIANTPQAFAREIRDEIARWAAVIRDANIRM